MLRLNRSDVSSDQQASDREASQDPADSVGGDKPVPGFVNPGTSASEREIPTGGMDRKIEKKLLTPKRIISVVKRGRGLCGPPIYPSGALYGHIRRPQRQAQRPKKEKGRVLRLNRSDVSSDQQASDREASQDPADSVGGDKPVPGFVNPGTSASEREIPTGAWTERSGC